MVTYYQPMRCFLSILLCFCASVATAQAKEFRFPSVSSSDRDGAAVVTIYSSMDIAVARQLIAVFQDAFRDTAVVYHDLQTIDLYERIVRESQAGKTADLTLSSAMDLQMKLANDGYALSWETEQARQLPQWASWRNEVFGVTFEPAVMVYNKLFFRKRPHPRNRAELIDLLSNRDPELFGRVSTYDAERSGLGFLFLSRDIQHDRNIWQIYRLLGDNGAKLYSTSQAIIDRVARGRLALGYNLLGSYAAAHAARDNRIGIVWPSDFTVIMSRVALIPRAAASAQMGKRFLRFMLSTRGQSIISGPMHMNALASSQTRKALKSQVQVSENLRPIRVGPGLLAYLDQAKRRRILKQWNAALAGGKLSGE
ncbi:MAG: ABC transporter substrate-binding protein [Pseudomonadota bacterium]